MYLYPGDPGYTGNGYSPEYVPDPPPSVTPPTIITASLPGATKGAPYAATIVVIGGTAPYSFAITAGALPAGLVLAGTTGVISGTPTVSGSFTFIVTATDAKPASTSASFTISIPSQPVITNSSLPVGTVGIPYRAALAGIGGAQPYGFSVLSGNLPSGLTLAATGGITGTPTVAGIFAVTLQIYDSNAPQGVGSSILSITIQPQSITNPVTTMGDYVLVAASDGGLYAEVPGQRYDLNYAGAQVGFLQKWNGVPGPTQNLAEMQIGGASVSAKGSGTLNVTAIDDDGNIIPISTTARPMVLSGVETKRDFMVKGVEKSVRFGIGFDNGGVIGAWFEAHVAILWIRPFFSGRKG